MGPPQTWALHGGSVCVFVEATHALVNNHKNSSKFTIECHTLRRVATVIVRRQKCCLSRASGVTVVVSEPSMVSVEFRLGRSWLFRSSGFLVASVCRTFEVG